MATLTHKRGATFRATIIATPDPSILAGASVACRARLRWWSGDLQCRLLRDDPRAVEVSALDTSDWPLGLLAFDLRVVLPNGETFSTETNYIDCVQEVTE